MRRIGLFIVLAGACLFGSAQGTLAAGNPSHQVNQVNWSQRDTAIYVVSTLNLLHGANGKSIVQRLTTRLGIAHFDVYADTQAPNLYFVELRKQNGDIAGAFAYQMGWFKPKSVTPFCDRLGALRAPQSVVSEYKDDSRSFMGSFTTTMPS